VNKYEIKQTNGDGDTLAVIIASTVASAARKHHPGAIRVTGDPGQSGCFQGYRPCGNGCVTSDGAQFHVSRIW